MRLNFIHPIRFRVGNATDLLSGFHEYQYDQLVKLHADCSVVILTAPLGMFSESYRLLRANQAK